MKNTIKTIALSVVFLSGTAMADTDTTVDVDTGLQDTLAVLSQQVDNGSALNLAINTADINASVNTTGGFDTVNNFENIIETTAIGAVNTGNIDIEQGSLHTLTEGTLDATLNAQYSQSDTWTDNVNDVQSTSDIASSLDATLNASFSDQLDQTLSDYSVANIAFNSGAIDASVNTSTDGIENNINGIKTSAIGAVNTGSITVTVK